MAFQIILIDLNGKLQATKIHNIMLMIDVCACAIVVAVVVVVDDDDDDVGALLSYVQFCRNSPNAIFKNVQQQLEKNERTNPICLMNHFSVFNTNYGRLFLLLSFQTCLNVYASMYV